MRARLDRRHERGPLSRGLIALGLLALLLAAPRSAQADDGDRARVLVHVAGPGRAQVGRAVERALERRGYRVLDARGGLDALGAEARRRGAAVIVDAELRGGRRPTLVVTVLDREGETLGRARMRARNRRRLVRQVRRQLWGEIGGAVTRGAQAARPAVADGERDHDDRGGDDDDERSESGGGDAIASDAGGGADAGIRASASPGSAGSRALMVSVSGELVSRRYSYKDDLFDELRGYSVALRPGIGVGAALHPAELGLGGPLRRLVVAAHYMLVPSFETVTADGRRYETKANAFRFGLRWVQPVGGFRLAGIADYAGRRFTMARGDALRGPAVPDVLYRVVRLGVSAETSIAGVWTTGGTLAYRHVLDAGEVMDSDDYFPRSSVRGADAELWLERPIPGGFDLRVAAAFEQYGYTLRPEPGDPMVAGGAADRYITLSLGLVYPWE